MADRAYVSVTKTNGKDKTIARDRGMAMYTRNVCIVNNLVVGVVSSGMGSGFTDLAGVNKGTTVNATMYMQ